MAAIARFLDQVIQQLRVRHYAFRTEQQYVQWVQRFILFHHRRHPARMAGAEVEAFLSFLANERKVSASTQNQALAALLFPPVSLQIRSECRIAMARSGRSRAQTRATPGRSHSV
jgi:hypothetical protein